ncbi:YjbF family lipoprotein [Ferrovum myxofaciens]|uniref:YjbF family lipoprotein n=1 Tax=Ferrovum myxofaciens TaxID=416213 RepID=UPI003EBF1489
MPSVRLLSAVCAVLLAACSSLDNPVIRTLAHATGQQPSSPPPEFNPKYRYLRIDVQGRVFYLTWAYLDQGVEVWYSPGREVLRLLNGRVEGSTGLLTEWRQVALPTLPPWTRLAKLPHYDWIRQRDVMPGYRYGIEDHLTLTPIAPVMDSHLQGLSPGSLLWFKEVDRNSADPLPVARYAVDLAHDRVVYGDTCLSRSLCFSWQRWPAGH